MRAAIALLAFGLLAACTPLTANAPLFTPADQDPALALAEGWWVARDADCKTDPARSRPDRESCLDWARITREADGRWLLSFQPGEDDDPLRVVLSPAVAKGARAIAPLSVAEAVNVNTGAIAYAGFVARGEPAVDGLVRRIAVAPVTCDLIEATGGIEGVEFVREDGRVVRCIAGTQAAVKEAARRAALDALPILGESDLTFVRP